MLDPLVRAPNGCGVEARAPHASVPRDTGKIGALQDPHVLGNRRQGHVEPRGKLADRTLAPGQAGEDFPPGRAREGEERGVEFL